VTCGLYIQCIIHDYIGTIVGLNRVNDNLCIDPRASGPAVYSNEGTPMGIGNQVSCEFNLLYRWHATISERDDKWTQELIKTIFPGKDISKLSIQEFQNGVYAWKTTINPKPEKRDLNMGTLKRHADGTFDDGELIKILTESIEDCAGICTSGN
jgi:hypothetical protein